MVARKTIVTLGLLALVALTAVPSVVADVDDEDSDLVNDVVGENEMEDEDEEEDLLSNQHPLTDMPEPSEHVETTFKFPNHETMAFPIGKKVDALVGLVNTGDKELNVTFAMGSLNSPFDFNYYMQNFSAVSYNTTVLPGEEYTFKYTFEPHSNLDPVDFNVALTVFYEDEDELFATTFFNQSVSFHEPPMELDAKNLFMWSVGVAASVALLYTFWGFLTKTFCKSRGYKSVTNGAASEEWTSGLRTEVSTTRRVVKKKKRSKKKSA